MLLEFTDRLKVKELLRAMIKDITVRDRLKAELSISMNYTEQLMNLIREESSNDVYFSYGVMI